MRYSSRTSLQLNAHTCTYLGKFVKKTRVFIECCMSAFSARERIYFMRELDKCMQVLLKDRAIALKLLTFAVPKDDNAFFDWWMLQISMYTCQIINQGHAETVITDEPCYVRTCFLMNG